MAIILIVDDAEFLRMRLVKMLTNLGHEVVQAENGAIAVRLYKSIQPNAVLMDRSASFSGRTPADKIDIPGGQLMENQLVVFELAHEYFGVDIAMVKGIIKMPAITTVLRAPAFVEGVTNLRGKVLPVIDLRKRFGLPAQERTFQRSPRGSRRNARNGGHPDRGHGGGRGERSAPYRA